MAKVIISCAITGGIHTPSMSPYLPITPEQIARESIDAAEAGAAIIHLHARDPETGEPSPDPAIRRPNDVCSRGLIKRPPSGQRVSTSGRAPAPKVAKVTPHRAWARERAGARGADGGGQGIKEQGRVRVTAEGKADQIQIGQRNRAYRSAS